MPKFYSNPNKYKEIIENNITPTKKQKFSSWLLIFALFFAVVVVGILSRSCTSRVIQTESRKLIDNVIFEIIAQNELFMGNSIIYKVNLSSNEFQKVSIKSFDTYIVYEGKKLFEYPSKDYPGPDTITTEVTEKKPRLVFSNASFPYYPTKEGTYLIVTDAYINGNFVELKKKINVLHTSPLNLSINSFFFVGQSLSGEIYLNNPYPALKVFKVRDVRISINGKTLTKSLNDSYTLTSGANVKLLNIQDFLQNISINKVGIFPLTLSAYINDHLETVQYPINIINKSYLTSSDGVDLNFSLNKYSYNIDDNFWFDTFIVNDTQDTKYFKIQSCSVIIKYKDTIIKSVNIPIERNLVLKPFERFKLFSSRQIWDNFKVINQYTITVSIGFIGKNIKQITKKYTIKMQ